MNTISSSIVLFKNEPDVLKKAIHSFLDTKLPALLYLIDNSPTDELKNVVIDKRIIYISNPSNPGFGAAHNIAIKKSMEVGTKYHLVLNPDVYFNPEIISDLYYFMENNQTVGNVMPKVYYPDGSLQYLCKLLPTPYDWIGRRFNPIRSVVNKRNNFFELRFTKYDKLMDVPYLSGCFMFLNTSILKKVGLFDENFFMYCEETDLCRRINTAGYRTVFYPNSFIFHQFQKGSHKSWRLTWVGIKSAIYYFNKWGWINDKERNIINSDALDKLKILKN